jgi:chorismate dehydratase
MNFYNEYFNPSAPARGAVEEAEEKFVKPCRIRELSRAGSVKILDVCFGIGYNSLSAIKSALEENPKCKVSITGLENCAEVIEKIEPINFEGGLGRYYGLIKRRKSGNVDLRIIVGDARESVKKLGCCFDAVFFDPFTRRACPELWQKQFLEDVSKVMKKGAVLATHSAGSYVKNVLADAGLIVKLRPRSGRWAESAFAVKP